jgi:hypothetical protein
MMGDNRSCRARHQDARYDALAVFTLEPSATSYRIEADSLYSIGSNFINYP